VFELAIGVWNAHVLASKFWGNPKSKALVQLRKAVSDDLASFQLLADRWREDFELDPRLVSDWSFDLPDRGRLRLRCETALPDGVEAQVPAPIEKRIAIDGRFLDEVRIRQSATAYLLYPIEHHRGVVGADGAATIRAKMASVAQLFAEGVLPPMNDRPVEVRIGVQKLGAMVLRELSCAGDFGRNDVAVLVFRPSSGGVTA
jgi:hypothetical protein